MPQRWTEPKTWSDDVLVVTGDLNAHVRDNENALYATKGFRAVLTGDIALNGSTWTKVPLGTETFDSDNWFDAVTNYRFLPALAGTYRVSVIGVVDDVAASVYVAIYKNGTIAQYARSHASTGFEHAVCLVADVELDGSDDYVEFYIQQTDSSKTLKATRTAMSAFFVGE